MTAVNGRRDAGHNSRPQRTGVMPRESILTIRPLRRIAAARSTNQTRVLSIHYLSPRLLRQELCTRSVLFKMKLPGLRSVRSITSEFEETSLDWVCVRESNGRVGIQAVTGQCAGNPSAALSALSTWAWCNRRSVCTVGLWLTP